MKKIQTIPYGKQNIQKDDIRSVVSVLRSKWLTTGPMVEKFELALAKYTQANYAVSLANGTAALHAALSVLNLAPGDEVLVTSITFVATANAILYVGCVPIFCDINPHDLLIDLTDAQKKITKKTKAIISVDYAGQPCDYSRIREFSKKNNLFFVSDACHSLGSSYKEKKIGGLADLTTLSFHPVKNITTGEGGAVVCNNRALYFRLKMFRNHGIDTDFRQREKKNTWRYEMKVLGYNYRLSDIHAALGLNQLKKLDRWILQRNTIAQHYNMMFKEDENIHSLQCNTNLLHAYHLYVVRVPARIRNKLFLLLRREGIGVNIHYMPVYMHPFYKKRFNLPNNYCLNSFQVYKEILTLPIYPGLKKTQIYFVAEKIKKTIHDIQKK